MEDAKPVIVYHSRREKEFDDWLNDGGGYETLLLYAAVAGVCILLFAGYCKLTRRRRY